MLSKEIVYLYSSARNIVNIKEIYLQVQIISDVAGMAKSVFWYEHS